MKNPKTYELMSHSHPGMRCPQCHEFSLVSNTDYNLTINLFGGGERTIKVHAIECEECDYVGFSKETMSDVLKEGIGTAGRVLEKQGDLQTRVLH